MINPYEILGVSPNSSKEDIERAYKEKAKTCHPDLGGSTEGFQVLVEAYKTLTSQPKEALNNQFLSDIILKKRNTRIQPVPQKSTKQSAIPEVKPFTPEERAGYTSSPKIESIEKVPDLSWVLKYWPIVLGVFTTVFTSCLVYVFSQQIISAILEIQHPWNWLLGILLVALVLVIVRWTYEKIKNL